jgi:hypothetical protein
MHRISRAHSSAGERSLHTGEVQGSIPCAPTINTIKSITYLTASRRLCPGNLGVQPGHRRQLMPDFAIDPRERIPPVQLLLRPLDSKSLARSHLRRGKARPALVPAPAMGRLRMVHGKSESRRTIADWTELSAVLYRRDWPRDVCRQELPGVRVGWVRDYARRGLISPSWTRPIWYCRALGGHGPPLGHAFAVTTPAHWIAQYGLG